MNFITLFFFLFSAVGISTAQLLMKKGSYILQQTFQGNFELSELLKKVFTIVFEPHVFLAVVLNFLVLFSWLKILARTELSFAYPILISLIILTTTIASVLIFKETLTPFKILGMLFIVIGLFVMVLRT